MTSDTGRTTLSCPCPFLNVSLIPAFSHKIWTGGQGQVNLDNATLTLSPVPSAWGASRISEVDLAVWHRLYEKVRQ